MDADHSIAAVMAALQEDLARNPALIAQRREQHDQTGAPFAWSGVCQVFEFPGRFIVFGFSDRSAASPSDLTVIEGDRFCQIDLATPAATLSRLVSIPFDELSIHRAQ